MSELRPELTVKLASGGHPELRIVMHGFKAVEHPVDRGDGTGWQLLTIATQVRFVAPHELPAPTKTARRVYRSRYREHDEPFGQWSEPVALAVVG